MAESKSIRDRAHRAENLALALMSVCGGIREACREEPPEWLFAFELLSCDLYEEVAQLALFARRGGAA